MQAITGFLVKFFSTDSIVSRLVRGALGGLIGGATPGDVGGVHVPSWLMAVIGVLMGMIPAGQNNSSAADASSKDVKAVPPKA